MARVTIEDCLAAAGGHFNVAKIAARRAHQLELGQEPKVERGDDKNTVIALREIAAGEITEEMLDIIPQEKAKDIDIAAIVQDDMPMASDKDEAEEKEAKEAKAGAKTAAKGEAAKDETPKTPKPLGDQITAEDVGTIVADVDAHSNMSTHDKPDGDDASTALPKASAASADGEDGMDAEAEMEALTANDIAQALVGGDEALDDEELDSFATEEPSEEDVIGISAEEDELSKKV